MANKSVFASMVGRLLPRADARNAEGAPAYRLAPRAALAQLAATGTFNATFYADARQQLDQVLDLATQVEPEFLAKTAVYAHEAGYMKDMPALLLAVLSSLPGDAFNRAFARVVTDGRGLRNFVQVMRSGAAGRRSLGSRPKRLVQGWLEAASPAQILAASVGNDPSLADVVRMVHPKPADAGRAALYAWLIGRPYDVAALPGPVQAFEAWKRDPASPMPDVPFQLLTGAPLTPAHWASIAERASWQTLRQGLNSFARHGVFEVPGMAERLAARLVDPALLRTARVMPYQLMVAHAMAGPGVPQMVRDALASALDLALAHVPSWPCQVVVCPDVSGSMATPVTGWRKGASTVVRCIDVAALVAAAVLRANPGARVLPFATDVVDLVLDPGAGVLGNAARLAAIGGGGTNCSAPLERLLAERAPVDLVVFVSDNESWVDAARGARGTAMMAAWQRLKARNPGARLVCIDLVPNTTTQAANRADVLNIGGFSDRIWDVIGTRAEDDAWDRAIEAVEL